MGDLVLTNTRLFQQTCLSSRQGGDDDDDDDDDEEPLQLLLYNHSVDILLQIYDSMHTHGWDDGKGCHTSCWAQALAPRGQLDLTRQEDWVKPLSRVNLLVVSPKKTYQS